ncbi:laminin subunit alpha-1 [Anabrus simplex]|uniref:laminin subunit alpha-1 n=1 Tax=Anabrus simplex TaxID=316456 RepID=UPI0035A39A42
MMEQTLICTLLLLGPVLSAGSKYGGFNKKDASDYGPNGISGGGANGGGLFPTVFNLASRASITANATCGQAGPEVYCKLVEHVQMREPQCGVCDTATKSHPITNAIDGTPSWWQSPTLASGPQFEWVTITLDLKQVYQVAYVIVKAAISPRPANWILERSTDGSTFSPWQYYAQSDEECWTRYGLQPTPGKPTYKSDQDVICTSFYSKLNPLEGGEIHTSLVNGRPGANDSSAELLDFTLARYVRLRLQKIRTLNAEFMSVSPGLDDASMRRRLFYSIKDISIGGQCVCFGHASNCPQSGDSQHPRCECQHNTCGNNCDRCCPLFNQYPWRAGTPQDGAQCEPCECFGHAESCRYDPDVAMARLSLNTQGDYLGGGVCVNCSAHTTGINCGECEDGWYRPSGVTQDDPTPCVQCNCHSVGTTGLCVKDDSQPGKVAGSCECKLGFAGDQCTKCAPRFRRYPRCEPCPCNPVGSQATDCEFSCICKANVEGPHCDRCKPGFFHLQENNPDGCMPCYCSEVTNVCETTTVFLNTVSTLSRWLVTDLLVSRTVLPSIHSRSKYLTVGNYELPGVESYYWLAPESWRGNRLTSYGTNLTFSVDWVVMRGDTSGKPTVGPNVILVGHNGLRLGYGQYAYRKTNITVTVPLVEGAWYRIPEHVKDIINRPRRTEFRGEKATRNELMSVLADVKHVLLRAKFHTDQVECSLQRAAIQATATVGAEAIAHTVESCVCPLGYTGLSCEDCQYGYVRVGKECRECNCNGHAATCDAITGACSTCEHNTAGNNCGRCAPGYYGDAEQGFPSDCQRCACPLAEPSNNFSPTCELVPDSAGKHYICTACPQGYVGAHCQTCAAGYFGNPLEPGSSCEPCNCNGGPCDALTGQCLVCHGNTEGWRCERCRPGHYGDPAQADCKPCKCSAVGSVVTDSCDVQTGQCTCRSRFVGRTCDQCQPGYGNTSANCVPCECNTVGSTSTLCDPVYGHCTCHPGVGGSRCDRCLPAHYNFSKAGCKGCGCNVAGSLHTTCDIITGQCSCRPNVVGRTCSACKEGYWGLSSRGECISCDCDRIGSRSDVCDSHTGQCPCKPGVGGRTCDKCLPRFYGFSHGGCSACEPCDKPGHLCDPDTGRCICPPFTRGATCAQCMDNAWGYEPSKGCKPCHCELTGAVHQKCDAVTGRCFCREGYAGDRCSSCARHYHGFPHCRRCDCHLAGTREDHCDVSIGQCSCDQTGQCPCKANVSGKKCQLCREGTFGLQAENADGCTQCFCFGRTTACTQAGLTWSQIMIPRPRTLSITYDSQSPGGHLYPLDSQEICFIHLAFPGNREMSLNGTARLNVTNNLYVIPGDAGDVRMGVSYLFSAPIYWQLPQQFLGDKVLSYGGTLRFTVKTEGSSSRLPSHVLSTYPLVQLQGNNIILEHFPVIPPTAGHYGVRFHESLWQTRSSSIKTVTREVLMVALQNVQNILIRASDSMDFTKVILSEVTLDTAVAVPGQPHPLARGVELCSCPSEYNSTSCQDPSIGFYRWYDNSTASSTIVIRLVGEARPCQCNGRSKVCHIETGHCLNCSDNTGGAHCERCAEGYYGDPAVGSCRPCPCPNVGQNFAVSCQVVRGKVITCHCRKGYTGKRCDRCAYGWFGLPRQEGGSCTPCKCNIYGSVSDECHEETGQCNCRVGITGRDCSQCQHRYILSPHGCVSCNDSCTGLLLNELDELAARLRKNAGHLAEGLVPPPWEPLQSVRDNSTELRTRLEKWLRVVEEASRLPHDAAEEMRRKAKLLLSKSRNLPTSSKHGSQVRGQATGILEQILSLQENIEGIVEALTRYGRDESGAISVDAAVKEAQQLLRTIQNTNMILQADKNNAVTTLRKCEQQLKAIEQLLSDNTDLNPLRQGLETLTSHLDDLLGLLKNASNTEMKVRNQADQHIQRISKPRGKVEQILRIKNEVDTLSDESEMLVNNASLLLGQANTNVKLFMEDDDEVSSITKALREKEGILYRLNPLYKEEYVLRAQEHADKLFRWAQQYRDLFNATRQDADFALRASQAYQKIVDALRAAQQSARNASAAADIAYVTAHPGSRAESLPEKAKATEAVSKLLHDRAEEQVFKVQEVQSEFEKQEVAVSRLKETTKNTEDKNNALLRDLEKLKSNQILKSTEDAMMRANKALAVNKETNMTANQITRDVDKKLRPLLTKISDDQDLSIIRDKLNEVQVNMLKSKQQWSSLQEKIAEQRKRFETWNNTIASRLRELQDKITQARHTANGIHLSVTSRAGVGCVRSYKMANLAPSTTSSIVISYAIESDAQDASLLYLSSETTKEFIAVEMVNRSIRFVWNAGGGVGVVTHPRLIETGKLKEDKNWYRIQVDRTSNIAKLSVRHQVLPDGSPEADGNPVTNTSEAGFSIVNVGPRDTVWVGGLPPKQPRPPQLYSTSTGLQGCLHQLVLDGWPLGLWNFATETKHACTACLEGAGQTKDEAIFYFSGDGYSSHNMTSFIPNKFEFSLTLKFRTLDENSLIFLGISDKKDQFVALMLQDGHIIFRIGYGKNSLLELNTTRKFNTGKWISCEAGRFFNAGLEQAQLLAYSEGEAESRSQASPSRPPREDDIPDLMEFVLGGIPPGFSFDSSFLKVPGSFLGCVRDIQLGNSGLNPLSGKFYGVEASCSLSPQAVSFQGRGYLHMESHPLKKKKSSFEFVFRTLQPNTFLMLTTSDEGYYSASLQDGHVVIYVGIRENRTVIESNSSYTDGQMHAVSVTKSGRKLELRVDEKAEGTGILSDGEYSIKVAGKAGGLFFGGVPHTMSVNHMVASTQPLVGAIKDVIFNNHLIKFDEPIAFEHAAIGRLGPEPSLEDPDFPPSLPAPPSECHKVASYSLEPGAVKFGDSPESYIRMNLGRKNILQRNFVLQFGFRTHYPNGLLFIVPPSRRKQRPYLMAMLRNKKITIEAKNKKDKSFKVEAPEMLNDGAWHHVSLQKEDHTLTLAVDSKPVGSIKVPKKLNFGNILYMGGLPKSGYPLPDKVVQSVEAFKGCVRQLQVNNQMEDLVGPRRFLHNVGQCFPQVERGSYFSGDAYAIYENEFQISDLQEFELQFRTSELSGILLSVSESSGAPALSLELNDGKVVMTCDTGDKKPLRVEHSFPTRYYICNNEWHSIHASYVPSGVTLKVDNFPNQYGLSQNGGNSLARTRSPLFVGGLPDNATGGTLGTRDNFRGCIRNLVIGRRQKDWTDMAVLENVHLNSCPISS